MKSLSAANHTKILRPPLGYRLDNQFLSNQSDDIAAHSGEGTLYGNLLTLMVTKGHLALPSFLSTTAPFLHIH
jgi:hypothetical protein